jgi:hypothetical protein
MVRVLFIRHGFTHGNLRDARMCVWLGSPTATRACRDDLRPPLSYFHKALTAVVVEILIICTHRGLMVSQGRVNPEDGHHRVRAQAVAGGPSEACGDTASYLLLKCW